MMPEGWPYAPCLDNSWLSLIAKSQKTNLHLSEFYVPVNNTLS